MQVSETHGTFLGAWRERLTALRNIPPGLKIVWESGPPVVASGIAFRVLAALIPLGILAVSRRIIDSIVAITRNHTPITRAFWVLVAMEFALALSGTILARLCDYCDGLLADRFTRHVSVRVMEHASRLDLSSYEDPEFYNKLERARHQATDRIGMVNAFGRLLQGVITALSLSISILAFSPWLLLLLIAGVIPAFVGESHFAFLGYALNMRLTPTRRQLDYLRDLGASKESAKELKLFGLAGHFSDRYSRFADDVYVENVSLLKRRLRASSVFALLSTLAYYSAYAYVILETVSGKLSVGTLVFLAGALNGASSNIQQIFSIFAGIADQALFLTDLLEFFSVEPKVKSKPQALPAPRPIRQGFEFQNVSFTYSGTTRLVLDKLSFRLGSGERIALVGENGQGKTTIVKLITRLYDPDAGRILLDGIDLREYDIDDLHREIAVIFQDFMRYEMTARENISVGKVSDNDNLGDIKAAAEKSLAAAVIDRLPSGYGQMLGRRFDGGVDLSGGEWQKIALARAYLRDSQLLILDEPTASLDARSEREVFDRFAELTENKMALLISHRFSTVRKADRILVLEDGKIAEDGCHDDLIRNGQRYSKMFELQAANYR
jgi:ATP-binding cassette subfamily B protein